MNKKILLITLVVGITNSVFSQQLSFYFSDSLSFVDQNLNPLKYTTHGGFHASQYSSCDVNGDGKKDIVVYDRLDGNISTFINEGGVGEVKYRLDNKYAAYFPKLRPFSFMLLRDYNNDGYEDLFTMGTQGYLIYKNISYTVSGRPEFIQTELIQYRNMLPTGSFIEYNVMSTPSFHLPGIYDLDHDGDLDIVSYSNVGGKIYLYQNRQADLGLPPDSLRFYESDLCWGFFTDFDCNGYVFDQCHDSFYRLYGPRHTSGSAITLFDANEDGDIDMLLGNESCNHLTMLTNSRKGGYRNMDSFSVADTLFVNATNRAYVSTYPAAYYLDVDNDGIRDLIYGPNSVSSAFKYFTKETDQVKWFKNTGKDLSPLWAPQAPLFVDQTIDVGNKNQWKFADWDKDGDLDAIVANNGDKTKTLDSADRIYLYENIGTKTNAKFKLVNTNFGDFEKERQVYLNMDIADMDNDGKLDLVCGNDRGDILFFRNTSATNNTLSPTFSFSNNTYNGFNLNIGRFSSPVVSDIDNDGLLDMVIGRGDSMLTYYKNTGSLTNPDFQIVTNRFGGIKPFDSIQIAYVYDDTNAIIDTFIVYEKNCFSRISIADVDNDGKKEIIVGNSLGTIRFYEINNSSPSSKFKEINQFHYRNLLQGDKKYDTRFGSYASPTFVDLDGNGAQELIVSMNRGGIYYLKPTFKDKRTDLVKTEKTQNINGFPNPATQKIEFNIHPDDIVSIEVFNNLGQKMEVSESINSNVLTLNTTDLINGFYIIQIRTKDQILYTSKFQIIK